MRFLRISQLLHGLALLAWIESSAALKSTHVRSRARKDVSANNSTASAAPTATEQTVYINSSDVYCPAANGLQWTLFRETCYYRYYAPFGIKETSQEDYRKHYKTWFEARQECAKLGAKLASVHDNATQEKLLQLVAGDETVTSLDETSWIGLQVGTLEVVEVEDESGETFYKNRTGCYWPSGVRPRLAENDPCPEGAVDECSVTYNDTFQGQWEDGTLYDEDESADFWSPDEPDQLDKKSCHINRMGEQNRAYCERGIDGKPDTLQHCALIVPPDAKHMRFSGKKGAPSPGKWVDFWCWKKVRGYVCERPAMRSGGSESSISPTITSKGLETQLLEMTMFCGFDTTTWVDVCTGRARAKIEEIQLQINATRIGYSEVIKTMVLGGAANGTTWLGASGSFGHVVQSAIDFGRNIARLSDEECIPDSRDLPLQLSSLSKTMEESYTKLETDINANTANLENIVKDTAFKLSYREYRQQVRDTLLVLYSSAVKTLRQGTDTGKIHYRQTVTSYCNNGEYAPQELMKKMKRYFVSSAPKGETTAVSDKKPLLDLLENESDSRGKVRLLMAEVDTVARLALTTLGVCAQSRNVPESELNDSSKKATEALTTVNDALGRALQNPTAEDIVALMNVTAHNFLANMTARLASKGWTGREELHQRLVDDTIRALKNHSRYVFNALASLPDDRNDRRCRQFPNDSVVDVRDRSVNFFVLYANRSSEQRANQTWEKLNENEDSKHAVLDDVFAKGSEDLCGRLTAALNDNILKIFRGFAAVKCVYEFVWYELGYTYFYAAYSSTDYKWQKKGRAFEAECGQLFFFP